MHPTDAELRAMIDGEVSADRLAALSVHLSECALCVDRSRALERSASFVGGLLDLADPAPIVLDPGALMQQAAALGPRRRPALIAAGFTLLAVAAAATVAGPRLVRTLLSRPPVVARPSSAVPAPATPAPPGQAAVSIVPGPDVAIALSAAQQSGVLRITTIADSELVLRSSAPVGYHVHAGGITVLNANCTADYELALPRRGGHVAVRVAGRVVFERMPDGVVRATAPPDRDGRYAIPVR